MSNLQLEQSCMSVERKDVFAMPDQSIVGLVNQDGCCTVYCG